MAPRWSVGGCFHNELGKLFHNELGQIFGRFVGWAVPVPPVAGAVAGVVAKADWLGQGWQAGAATANHVYLCE